MLAASMARGVWVRRRLGSRPLPAHLQFTDLLAEPPAPRAFPGSWEGREGTFPGTVTGPEDSLPFGTESRSDPGPSWGCHKPFTVTAGTQRVSLKSTAKGRHADPGLWNPAARACGCCCLPTPALLALGWLGGSCPSSAVCSPWEGVP